MTSPLHEQRLREVERVIRQRGPRTVLDLGCGDGDLLVRLAGAPSIEHVVGVDLSAQALERLSARLPGPSASGRARVDLVHAAITDVAESLGGFDCAVLLETIEHVDPGQLSALERAVFDRQASAVSRRPSVSPRSGRGPGAGRR